MKPNLDILKGMNINSSLSDIDASLSDDEYKDRLISLLQPILDQKFSNNVAKQKIRVHKDRISCACPYCDDSMKSDYKKRGNIILKGKFAAFYKCFNCGVFKKINKFFEDFKTDLDLATINHIAKESSDFSTKSNIKYDISVFLDKDYIDKYAFDRNEFLSKFRLKEVKETSIIHWLNKRLQYDHSKFMYDPRTDSIIILNLTSTGKILGAQKRLFKGQNKYLTYKLSKLHELLKTNIVVPDEIDAISQIFNICLINYSRKVTMFEGAFDAFLFKNSLANAGANKGFPFDLEVRYFYDSDKTGINKSIQKINNKEYVFLWNKFLKDVGAPAKNKHDLNSIMIWAKENKVSLPLFDLYFSNDPLDALDI